MEERKMSSKQKYIAVGITVALISLLGAATFMPVGIPRLTARPVETSARVIDAKACPAGQTCPYAECPYLAHLHQMDATNGSASNGASGVCPYESRTQRATAQEPTARKDIIAVKTTAPKYNQKYKIKNVALLESK